MIRRPHWDDDLIDAVFRALFDLDESVYPLIAAVEDWEKETFNAATEVLVERIQKAEAQVQRVRELHYNTATHHPSGCCSECGGTYPCPTVRALDGGAE